MASIRKSLWLVENSYYNINDYFFIISFFDSFIFFDSYFPFTFPATPLIFS